MAWRDVRTNHYRYRKTNRETSTQIDRQTNICSYNHTCNERRASRHRQILQTYEQKLKDRGRKSGRVGSSKKLQQPSTSNHIHCTRDLLFMKKFSNLTVGALASNGLYRPKRCSMVDHAHCTIHSQLDHLSCDTYHNRLPEKYVCYTKSSFAHIFSCSRRNQLQETFRY